jgi:hypothetical protein
MNQASKVSQNVLNEFYRQPETVQLSPDALVFINGSNLLSDPSGEKFDFRQDITEINISLSTDTVPGTANFTITYPEHSGGRFGKSKYNNLLIMSEVVIYFRGRFLKNEKYPYYQVFWGVISAITENYSDGVHTISVSCADILRWWQITNITINPSLISSLDSMKSYLKDNYGMEDEQINLFLRGVPVKTGKENRKISIFSNIFANQTIPEILSQLCTVSLLQMMPVADYLQYSSKASGVTTDIRDKMISGEQMKYWAERLNSIGRRLRIYALTDKSGKLDIDPNLLLSGREFIQKKGDKEIKTEIGESTVVYQMFPNAPSVAKSDRKSQLEIANELKEAIHYEFFMDVNGDIIFKPPFYNLDVGQNTPNSIIHDVDIINWNFVQSESEVVTRLDVSGAISQVSTYNQTINGIAYDQLLALQFGERPQQRSMPWLRTGQQCLFWARAELARQNALVRQGTATIVGRPELRLGYPVFIPSRDAFYYVKGIEHRFTFGGTFTTTLTLVAERRKGNPLNLFRNVGEVKDEQTPILGDSIAEPDDVNNFVKQMAMMNVCTPRAQEHVEIVEPNFTIDLSKSGADARAEWNTVPDSHIDPESGKEFQISDADGYEIIGKIGGDDIYLRYGYGIKLNAQGTMVDTSPMTETQTQSEKKAEKALSLAVVTNDLKVDPNNNSIDTLDSLDSLLIDYGNKKSAPEKALTAGKPQDNNK